MKERITMNKSLRKAMFDDPRISVTEKAEIAIALNIGAQYGYGNIIAWLATEWACELRDKYDLSEEMAIRAVSNRRPHPLPKQEDI